MMLFLRGTTVVCKYCELDSIEIAGVYHYIVELIDEQPLSIEEVALLQRLLDAAQLSPSAAEFTAPLLLVVPRPGTQSPWSSKAIEILHCCRLTHIQRIERGVVYDNEPAVNGTLAPALLHDRMTEVILPNLAAAAQLFDHARPRPLTAIQLNDNAVAALNQANQTLGLALSAEEINYLADSFIALGRDPTDVELMMFAQANSEHCRHKIFNAQWVIDDVAQPHTLFDMIRASTAHSPAGILSAYSDNAAVITGWPGNYWHVAPNTARYQQQPESIHFLIKVETHNHPTAIAPDPGAATGVGGEIRDEGATGIGAKPRIGLCGFAVSNLRMPGFEEAWELDYGRPDRIVSAFTIMRDAPIGAAAFNNEFGRPNLLGYFRTFEQLIPAVDPLTNELTDASELRGYHKPIMLAGGLGAIRPHHVIKKSFPPGTPLVVLGGPAMLIGLGGGAASSMTSGSSAAELDFASVQRANPQMQRRCQEVIDRCCALGDDNPILFIHDVGAGGLSNALPELVHDGGRGGRFELRAIPSADSELSPLEIWCNEAQERYVLAIAAAQLEQFAAICTRERCPFAVVGTATDEPHLVLTDELHGNTPIDLPLSVLFGHPPRMTRTVTRMIAPLSTFNTASIQLEDAVNRLLHLPTIAAKTFLITIGDRTVTGLVARDQLVGPWQVPVADCAAVTTDFDNVTGAAMALGERAPVALLNAPAAGRLAVAEAVTNLAAAPIAQLSDIRLSANWMAAAGQPGEEARLFDTVQAVALELCPALGIAIPVGKDSLSMRTVWQQPLPDGSSAPRSMTAPLSLVISAVAPVTDVRGILTPQLRTDQGATVLLLIDLGRGQTRLGGSCLAQVYQQLGGEPPDLDDPALLRQFFAAIQQLNAEQLLLAYHDRSDGGLFVTLCEMAFAGRTGLAVTLDALPAETDPIAALFAEELGAVIQVRHAELAAVREVLAQHQLDQHSYTVATLAIDDLIRVTAGGQLLLSATRAYLQQQWALTSWQMQRLRDDPSCADEEYARIADHDSGLQVRLTFDPQGNPAAPLIATGARPRVAIVREQGVNGQAEMAAAFERAGFECYDVPMADIVSGDQRLDQFNVLAACGGFSYGDVLGAGAGWANSILFNPRARDQFAAFFQRSDTLALGVCNGCQMLARLRELIPGTEHWPQFVRNRSQQFEARLVMVEVQPSPSPLFAGMAGSRLPISVAHGEGRAEFASAEQLAASQALVTVRLIESDGTVAAQYPANPNASPDGITGLTSSDGRFNILMPHPERLFRTVQYSWHPPEWGEDGPWLRLFRNARAWVG